MKNTIRVRHNGGKTSRPSQAQTSRLHPMFSRAMEKQLKVEGERIELQWKERIEQEFALPADAALPANGVHPCCVALYDRETREPISRVPLTEAEFLAVWKSGPADGLERNAAENFIASAIREKLARINLKTDLESAMWQANSFMQLLIEKLYEVANGPNEFSGESADKFLGGVQVMLFSVSDQLEKAVHDEMEAGKPVAAVP